MSGISSQQKEGSSKTREQGLKTKEVKPHMKSPMLYKKREDEIYMLLEEILSKERKKERKEITYSYSAKSDVWPHPYPHIICICTTFYSLTFPFLTPVHYTILHQP
jgi:hypothetical protein